MAWTSEQLSNAAIIYRVGIDMGMSMRDIQIGLITAMVESNLINVNYGDRDSLGLFQQRPSQGWGTPEQVTDPVYAAGKFFSALKGLGDSRYQMSMGSAAQAVQRSAYPDRYGERIGDMRTIWPQVQKMAGDQPMSMDGQPYGQTDPVTGASDPAQPMNIANLMLDAQTGLGPTANPATMLGAWGVDMQTANWESGLGTFLSQATNQSVIQPLAQSSGEYTKGVDGWRKAVIEYAKAQVGTPYVWGGSAPGGFDCSGLLQWAFQKAGLDLPRVSYAQANFGTRVGLDGLQPGDLYAWDNSSRNNGADHIALYLGNGMILEAPRTGLSVRIRKLDGSEGGWGVHLNF